MTYDEFMEIALRLPDTSEAVGHGNLGVNREDKCMFWLKKGVLLCIKIDWENHDRLLEKYPGVLYKTPHFDGYPAFHANLDLLTEAVAEEVLKVAWDDGPNKVHFRRKPKS